MVLLGGALVAVNVGLRQPVGTEVTVETLITRDLEGVVSAPGTIQAQRQVDVSSNMMGRVTRVAIVEGQRVEAGQLLLEIDPRSLEGERQRGEAGVAAARSALEQARAQVVRARASLELARQALRREEELGSGELTTREALERAQTDAAVREADVRSREQALEGREQEIRQAEAGLATTEFNLSQVTVTAPIDGIVTRLNIEEGENVVVGTRNNAGTVLATVADLSAFQAEVEFEETVIPLVRLGQPVEVEIDAVPGRTFQGRVTEIGSSALEATGGQGAQQVQATRFRVVVTLEGEIPDVRPGFSCVANITTATRRGVLAVPIQALTIEEVLFAAAGELVREEPRPRILGLETTTDEPPDGFTREDTRGVFVFRDGVAVFTPVRVGVAGERYFEVLLGLGDGDHVITGPFAAARRLVDGDAVWVP